MPEPTTTPPRCLDCGTPLTRKGARRCRVCANKARAGTQSESARRAALVRHRQAKENARLAELARAAGLA